MISLESEIENYLRKKGWQFENNRKAGNRLDFVVRFGDVRFHLEAKEKRQRIYTRAWPKVDIAEKDLFIVDELSIRKMLLRLPNCGLVVRDNIREHYFFCSIADLVLMPRVRVNRPMYDGSVLKGKWMVDLRNMVYCGSFASVLKEIDHYLRERSEIFTQTNACYGVYAGEEVSLGGEVRTWEHRQMDYANTRGR